MLHLIFKPFKVKLYKNRGNFKTSAKYENEKIIIIALCVILPVACVIAAPFVINLNNYKGKIVNIAKSNLGRDMDFDNIEISLLSGLGAEIRGLRIAENPEFGKGDFVHLERLLIKIKLFPLLKKQVQVKELILKSHGYS